MAALLAGQSIDQVAEQYDLPRSTVGRWKIEIPTDGMQKRSDDFEELTLGYLRANLESLRSQVEFFGDRSWLKEQPANELAILHGVQADKAFRILGALERLHQANEDGNDPDPTPPPVRE